MAGTFDLLGIGWSALASHRLAGEVVGHNMANAATPGYSRQRADLLARDPWLGRPGPIGTGVDVLGISQARDEFVERSLLGANAGLGFQSERVQVLTTLETAFGVGADDPIDRTLQDFFSALRDLASNPGGAAERTAALAAGRALGDAFRLQRTRLEQARSALDGQVAGMVSEVQSRLEQIAELNQQIRLQEASGGSANDLRDRRAMLANEVAERVSVVMVADDRGNLNLALTDGTMLVNGERAARLTTEPQAANDGLLAPVVWLPDGSQRVLDESVSGRLGGLLSARDGEARRAMQRLDELAFGISQAVNAQHRAGVGLDGIGGRDFFTPIATQAGAALQLRLDAAVDGAPDALAAAQDPLNLPGDNRNALALADLQEALLFAGGSRSAGEFWRSAVTDVSAGLEDAGRALEQAAARIAMVSQVREAVSGVSLDEEMIELSKAQRAFEAAAKVIQAGDEMLEVILSLKRD
ncbi:MAG: flagellar hook-associated protein FlgK [Myxococcales bacterium]|nr:flagellar hook-associated protein FlgK [Myxococcales bacterium]